MFLLLICVIIFFFFKQKTAYEMRISDWSSDVCSSDLVPDEDPQQSGDERIGLLQLVLEHPVADHDDRRIGQRRRRGHAWTSVDQRHFAEDADRPDDAEPFILAGDRPPDLDLSDLDDVVARALVDLPEDRGDRKSPVKEKS